MIFLENPAKRRKRRKTSTATRSKGKRRKKRSPPKGFASWGAYMASIRPGAKRKRKRKTTRKATTKRRRRRTTTEGKTMARKRRRTTKRKHSPRRRRRYAHNPPLLATVMRGAKAGAAVTAGKAAARIIGSKLPLPKTGPLGLVSQLAVAFGVSYLAKKAPAGSRAFIEAGAFGAVIEDAIVGLNLPMVSSALDAYPLSAYPGFGALYEGDAAGLDSDLPAFAAYPHQ